VKVLGQGAGLSPDERHELLGAFNLQALAALNPASAPKALPQAKPQASSLAGQSPATRPRLAAQPPAAQTSDSAIPSSPTQLSANMLAALTAARAAAHRETAVLTPAA